MPQPVRLSAAVWACISALAAVPLVGAYLSEFAFLVVRLSNIVFSWFVHLICVTFPQTMRAVLMSRIRAELPPGHERHFNPPYNPWEQRSVHLVFLCFIHLFHLRALRVGVSDLWLVNSHFVIYIYICLFLSLFPTSFPSQTARTHNSPPPPPIQRQQRVHVPRRRLLQAPA